MDEFPYRSLFANAERAEERVNDIDRQATAAADAAARIARAEVYARLGKDDAYTVLFREKKAAEQAAHVFYTQLAQAEYEKGEGRLCLVKDAESGEARVARVRHRTGDDDLVPIVVLVTSYHQTQTVHKDVFLSPHAMGDENASWENRRVLFIESRPVATQAERQALSAEICGDYDSRWKIKPVDIVSAFGDDAVFPAGTVFSLLSTSHHSGSVEIDQVALPSGEWAIIAEYSGDWEQGWTRCLGVTSDVTPVVEASGKSAYAILRSQSRRATVEELAFIAAQANGRYLGVEAVDE